MFNCEKTIDAITATVTNPQSTYFLDDIVSTKCIIDPYGMEWYRADNLVTPSGGDYYEVYFKKTELEFN